MILIKLYDGRYYQRTETYTVDGRDGAAYIDHERKETMIRSVPSTARAKKFRGFAEAGKVADKISQFCTVAIVERVEA